MSAIAGYWDVDRTQDSSSVAVRMMETLRMHGPDRLGFKSNECLAIGHRLLQITHEDTLERQPCLSLGSQFWLVADARIDNRCEVSEGLGITAEESSSCSDSSLILKAWERWGKDCVHHLVGAFAFAVWDITKREFFLARDHSGERPLFYRKTPRSFAFATTVRAILSCPGVSGELDDEQLGRDLVGLPPGEFRTRFRDVDAVAPGHSVIVREADLIQQRYWQFDSIPETRFTNNDEYVEAFLHVFDEAVRCRLRSSGGVACELSAGLDSGSVAATAARLLKAESKGLTAFTSVPRNGYVSSGIYSNRFIEDEGPYASEVAAMYSNVKHILVDSSRSNMLDELKRSFGLLDFPPCAAALNSVWCNVILDQAVAGGAKVLLNGALGNFTISYAGDEILYPLFNRGHWVQAAKRALQMRRTGLSSGRHAASLIGLSVLPWGLQRRVDPLIRNLSLKTSAIRADRAQEWNLLNAFRSYIFQRNTCRPRCQETFFHQNQYGEYNAAANAGWGIDVRDPTADKRVFEFCASIPPEQFLIGGEGRSLVRRAMKGRLPEATLRRTRRGMQSADWYDSLSEIEGALVKEIAALKNSPGARRVVDLDRLSNAVNSWPKSAKHAAESQEGLYPFALTRGIACGYFIRRVEESFQNPQ